MSAPAARPLYWSVRRELWENRSLYVAPLSVGALLLAGIVVHSMMPPHEMPGVASREPAMLGTSVMPYSLAATALSLTSFIVGALYCLDALYGERRDRSLLFWKSLPVSDLTTVLAKASIPLVVLPLLTFAVLIATQLAMLLLSGVLVLAKGLAVGAAGWRLPLAGMSLVPLYGLLVHALWYAPLYTWLLLVSAWARRAVLLWALLPLLAPVAVERVAFGTSYLLSALTYRLNGARTEAFRVRAQNEMGIPILQLSQLDPLGFLGSPGLWIGLALAGAFLAAAVRLRRDREPI